MSELKNSNHDLENLNIIEINNNTKEYKINLETPTITKIKKFCNILQISEAKLLHKLLVIYLNELKSEISFKNYEFIERYLDFSSLFKEDNYGELKNSNFNSGKIEEFLIEINNQINQIIIHICKIIKITPNNFIKNIIEDKIQSILIDIKEENFEFIEFFVDIPLLSKKITDNLDNSFA